MSNSLEMAPSHEPWTLPTGENLNRGVSRRKARRRAECGCTNLCGPPREPPCPSVVNPRPVHLHWAVQNGTGHFPWTVVFSNHNSSYRRSQTPKASGVERRYSASIPL